MRKIIWVCLAASLSGCLAAFDPQLTYERDIPVSETAVVGPAPGNDATGFILSVNGKPTSCWKIGCPRIIRVAQGKTELEVQAKQHPGLTYRLETGKIKTAFDALAGHTYFLHIASEDRDGKKYARVWIEDKGVNQPMPREVIR